MNNLCPGDFVWLNITSVSPDENDPSQTQIIHKNKIALCAHPGNDFFFLVNTHYYPWAADGLFKLNKHDLDILKYDSWLNLASIYEASQADYNASDLSRIFRLRDSRLYQTILYKIRQCSIITRGIKDNICTLWTTKINISSDSLG